MARLWYYFKSIFELLFGFRAPLQLIKIFLGSDTPRKLTRAAEVPTP